MVIQSSPLKCGVLICGAVQLLDIAAVDVLGMITPEYLRACKLPDAVVANGQPIEFIYILDQVKRDGEMPQLGATTAGMKIHCSGSLDTVGHLDYLFVPGPDPFMGSISPELAKFIQNHTASVRNILIVCSGIVPIAYSGVLSGRRVTAPLPLVPVLQDRVPDAKWTKKRWEVDEEGKVWTSGGVTNGIDMMIEFVKKTFGEEMAGVVCRLADIQERSQEYPKEQLEMMSF